MVLDTRINTYTSTVQDPSVAALTNGGFVVTWASLGQDGNGYGIYGQRYGVAGNATGAEFRINSYTTSNQDDSSVTALTNGGFVVTWTSDGQDGSGTGIYGQRYDASGNPIGTEFNINTYTTIDQKGPAVTGLTDGGFVVTWWLYRWDGSDHYGIYGQRYDASGKMQGAEFRVNTYISIDGDRSEPSVTALTNGGFVVTWESYGQDGSGSGIYGQRYDASGNPRGAEFRINTYTTYGQREPTVTALTDGGFVVIWWSHLAADDSGSGFFGQRYDATGVAQGAELRIAITSIPLMGIYKISSATSLADGGFVVTWESYDQDGSLSGIYGHRYDASGNPRGAEFRINTYTKNNQSEPAVTALTDGGFVVTWESNDVSGYGIFGKRFDANGNEVEWVGTYNPEPEDSDGKTADEIFKSELSANEKLVKGAEEAGMIRVMADFSKAAYHLGKHENTIINDFSDFAEAARDEVIAQGWQPLDFNFESKSDSFFYTNHDLDSKREVIQTNGMSDGFYTNGNAAALIARSDDAAVISFRGTNDYGDNNPTDSENDFYPEKEDWDDAGRHYYELLLPLIHEFDKYVSENGISKVYVTGHSLGGAMAINYMRTHPDDPKYQAVTFAAPAFISRTGGITVTESDFHPDSRTTQIEISKDPVPMTWDILSVLSDTNRPGDVIRFAGDKTLDGLISTDNHSMDYYRQIADSVDASIWQKILAEAKTEDQNVFIGGRKNGDNFIVDGRKSGENKILDDGNDKLFGPDTGEYDFFYGGRGLDKLTGGVDKEFFYGGSGNDIIDGDFGIDNAIYSASRSNYTLQLNESLFSADQRIVTDHRTASDNEGTDTLENIERLIFTDSGLAFDLDGSAGMVAKLIGAVFGAGSVANTSYVAIGLSYLDSGASYEDLATLAINAAGAKSPEQIVTLLWTNVVGSPPTADQAQPFIDMLNSGTSLGELGVRAADYSLNQANINLVGLAENGIVFDPLHYQPIG